MTSVDQVNFNLIFFIFRNPWNTILLEKSSDQRYHYIIGWRTPQWVNFQALYPYVSLGIACGVLSIFNAHIDYFEPIFFSNWEFNVGIVLGNDTEVQPGRQQQKKETKGLTTKRKTNFLSELLFFCKFRTLQGDGSVLHKAPNCTAKTIKNSW